MTNTVTKKNTEKQALEKATFELLSTLKDFNALLLTETAALKKADFKKVELLQPEKRTLAKKYHEIVTSFSQHKTDITMLDLALREKLIRARTEFTMTLNDNMRALESSKNSTKRLIDRILETARNSVVDGKQTHYSEKGQTGSYRSATLSISVDQNL